MNITIIKKLDNQTREKWSFNLFDLSAVFIGFKKEIKPENKRLWKSIEVWDKYSNSRGSNIEEPELNESIRLEVLKEVANKINVFTWSEWKS